MAVEPEETEVISLDKDSGAVILGLKPMPQRKPTMGRQAKFSFTLPDGKVVGYSFKEKYGYFRVRFVDPVQPGRYIETSTGCTTKADAYTAAAKIVLKAYSPSIPADLKKTDWPTAIKELSTAPIRPKTLVTYLSTISLLREFLPDSKGPNDITSETAQRFAKLFASTPFKRGKASDAKTYVRSAQTVSNQIANCSIVWNHFKDLGFITSNPWDSVKRPKLSKRVPTIPSDDKIKTLFQWLEERYPGWELIRLFIRVKMLSGCRLYDLCLVESWQVDGTKLHITADQDKTHKERDIPLPPEVADALNRLKGPKYLWEHYCEDAKVYRPSKYNKQTFTPKYWYQAVKAVFKRFGKVHPEAKIKSHDLRKRLITLAVLSGASVDEAAQAVGMTVQNAQRHYLDVNAAYKGSDLLKRLQSVADVQ